MPTLSGVLDELIETRIIDIADDVAQITGATPT